MVPRRACIQGVLKVKVEVKGHVTPGTFLISRKSLLLTGKCSITPKVTHDDPQTACIQDVLKVTVEVKGHVIRAL